MIALALRFPSGRFHSTPWGRHVNEGSPEWPPSPWRLLRAFVATWKRKLDGNGSCSSAVVEELLRAFSSPPVFSLPPVSTSHTRHFMPWFKKGPGDKTSVFDAFVALDKQDEVVVFWPDVELSTEQWASLSELACHLGFLGRAESWVEARIMDASEAQEARARINCVPALDGNVTAGREAIRVLCADPKTAFGNEHTPKHTRSEGRGRGRKEIKTPLYDPDWHLCMETLELHKQRWSDPPGSRWVTYLRPTDCFAIKPKASARRFPRPKPTVARFALDGVVLPLVEETLKIAETARWAMMGTFRRIEERRLYGGVRPDGVPLPRSDVFSGKDTDGNALHGHRHAYFLPTDEDDDGRIDHLTIVAAVGFGPQEAKVFDRLRRLKRDQGDPLNLLLLALGQIDAIAAPRLLGPSTTWISATPFIVTRHQKSRGRKKDLPELLGRDNQRAFSRQVLIEEIARLRQLRPEIPEPVSIEPLDDQHRMGAHQLRPIQFKRFRQKRSDDGGRRPSGAFRIVFSEPVRGPICLGHSSHFGIGMFVAEE